MQYLVTNICGTLLEIRMRNWLAISENKTFYKLLITVPLKMYRKHGFVPKWILVGQMLKFVVKWPTADCYFWHRGTLSTWFESTLSLY